MTLDPIAVVIAALAVGGVAALLVGVRSVARRPDPIAGRLGPAYGAEILETTLAAPRDRGGALARLLAPLARIAMPMTAREVARLRERLQQGGNRTDHAVTIHVGTKLALALAALVAFLVLTARRAEPLGPPLLTPVLVFALGYYLPDALLASRIRARQTAIGRGLPDGLDLLVTCVEAGLGLDAALQRVSQELALAWPLLGEELRLTFLEIKAGIPRVEAFRRLAARTGVQELKSLSATLVQTEIFGTSVALALRVQAEGMRVRRIQRAEERAAYASVKMVVPLVTCILPALFVILIGPAAIKIAEILLPTLAGETR